MTFNNSLEGSEPEPSSPFQKLYEKLTNNQREMFRDMALVHKESYGALPGEEFIAGYTCMFQILMTDNLSRSLPPDVAAHIVAIGTKTLHHECRDVLEILKGDQ